MMKDGEFQTQTVDEEEALYAQEGGSIEGENEVRYSLISNIFLVVLTHHIIYSIIGHPECH